MQVVDDHAGRVDSGRGRPPGYRPAQFRRSTGDVAQASLDWVTHHPYAMAHGKVARWVGNPAPQRGVALAKTPVVRRAKVGDKWHPIDSNGNVQGAPSMKVEGRLHGGHSGQLSREDLNALGSVFGPENLSRMRQETLRREGHSGGDTIGNFIRGTGHPASVALGFPMFKTAGDELVHWHISDADKAAYQREQAETEAVDKAVLKGMAPQTAMAVAHGHAPSVTDYLWDATLFGGPTMKLLRGAREATLGLDAVRAAREARAASRAEAAAARAAGIYRHPSDAWLDALEERQGRLVVAARRRPR